MDKIHNSINEKNYIFQNNNKVIDATYKFKKNEIINSKYEIIDLIEDSSLGHIFKVKNIENDEIFAMKIFIMLIKNL